MRVDELNDELVCFPLNAEVFVEINGKQFPIADLEDTSQGVVLIADTSDKDMR
jgi:hypothetical protein